MEHFQDWLLNLSPLVVHLLLFLLLLIEGIGTPGIPFEALWVVEGIFIHQGKATLPEAILWGTLGNWLGNLIGYLLGDRISRYLPKRARESLGIEEVRSLFNRWGVGVVLFSRWMGLIRTPTILYAGAIGMPFWKYAFWSFIGALSWVGIWQVGCWYFGSLVLEWWDKYKIYIVLFGILVGAIGVWTVIRKRKPNDAPSLDP
ncbi:DedA family protein [Deinococcus roseus]|uniref:VTT domain-containing protein n=1 Tax=Deinococcus roseus TaxID=392414 RepID=A0ABQ2CXJ3_9DEIO|nr:DedA family protein [Deinococcus roseus]GGJ30515.1 hypothetical protein GCM10008938_15730 [Deinococcus roseus]